jgi:SAM-dependent methyltransferase
VQSYYPRYSLQLGVHECIIGYSEPLYSLSTTGCQEAAKLKDYTDKNRELWDKWTPIHRASEFYDVEGFLKGRCTLGQLDRDGVGDVSGKSLLHLQCHFGLDTLSWARYGADVVGVDFSPVAIETARGLSIESGLEAEFICCDVFDVREKLARKFDVVFTSGGVIAWLPDLKPWGRVIADSLVDGGIFFVRDFHPFAYTLDDVEGAVKPLVRYPYFNPVRPLRFEDQGTYADLSADITSVSYEWPHSISEIIASLLDAGLRLDSLHEFPYSTYKSHPFLVQGEDNNWRYPGIDGGLPLMFSIRARKSPS